MFKTTKFETFKATLQNGCCWKLEDGSIRIFSDPGYLKNYSDGEYYIMIKGNKLIDIVPC